MKTLKANLRYINQWDVIFYALILIQVWASYIEGNLGWHTVWSIALVWALFMIGYNSLDRELEIKLNKVKEAVAKRATQN